MLYKQKHINDATMHFLKQKHILFYDNQDFIDINFRYPIANPINFLSQGTQEDKISITTIS